MYNTLVKAVIQTANAFKNSSSYKLKEGTDHAYGRLRGRVVRAPDLLF